MNNLDFLLNSWSSQKGDVDTQEFVLNLLLAAVLSYLLGRVYVRFGSTLSNREMFSRNFLIITMTTMVIITIVRSSLALSLGLMGALSIIRFRAAIKEPEELAFLFVAISVGLGMGAGETRITGIAFAIIVSIIIARHYLKGSKPRPNLYLSVSHHGPDQPALPQLVLAVKAHASRSELKRYDESHDSIEAAFQANFDSIEKVDACTEQLRKLSGNLRISLHEDRGLGA
jgi:uncharacterized membrane protein YhiD involved in acid resistance